MNGRRAIRLSVVLATSAAIGCATAPPESPPFDVISTHAPSEALGAEILCPLAETQWIYRIDASDGQDRQIIYRRLRTERYKAAWVTHQGDERSEFWRLDESGNVVMPAVISQTDRAISLFKPPLIVAYNELAPGELRKQVVAMRVVDARNPTRQRETGTATQTIEYVDDQLIRTPIGEILTRRVIVNFKADLQFADAQTSSVLYVNDALGIVVQERLQLISVLGLSARRHAQTLLLTSDLAEDSPSP